MRKLAESESGLTWEELMAREVLPARRAGLAFDMTFAAENYHVTLGFYPDKQVGEVFITRIRDKSGAKLGVQLEGMARDAAILLSLAFQHGTPIETIRHAVTRDEKNQPTTIIGAVVDRLFEDSQ